MIVAEVQPLPRPGWDQRSLSEPGARLVTRSKTIGRRMLVDTWLHADDGQGLVEYGLIIAVIAIAVIVAMAFMRDQISNIFSNIGNDLT